MSTDEDICKIYGCDLVEITRVGYYQNGHGQTVITMQCNVCGKPGTKTENF